MEYLAGLDISLETTNICIVDGDGAVVKEAKVASGGRSHRQVRTRAAVLSCRRLQSTSSKSPGFHDLLNHGSSGA